MQRRIVQVGARARSALSEDFGAALAAAASGSEAASSEVLEPAQYPLGPAMEVGEVEAVLAALRGPLL